MQGEAPASWDYKKHEIEMQILRKQPSPPVTTGTNQASYGLGAYATRCMEQSPKQAAASKQGSASIHRLHTSVQAALHIHIYIHTLYIYI